MKGLRVGQKRSVACGLFLSLLLFGCGDDDTAGPGPGPGPTVPDAPGAVTAAAGDGAVAVIWAPSSGATSYNIYWGTSAGVTTADSLVSDTASPFIHEDRTNDTTYYYIVTAVNSVGESETSAEVSAKPIMSTVYVSVSTGDDGNDGSRASPVKTLARGYAVAQSQQLNTIRLETGVYDEVPAFEDGIWVEGGHDLPDWTVGTDRSLFNLSTTPATANDVSTTTIISNIELITSQTATENSIALYSSNSASSLVFENCRFVAGAAGSGTTGAAGGGGAPGGDGSHGESGNCDGPHGQGGSGGTAPTPACVGGGGGHGGAQGANNGVTGVSGGCNGGVGGAGGIAGGVGINGRNGRVGSSGSPGTHGTSASPNGTVQQGQWRPFVSEDGGTGGHGSGGGGGGGGAGQADPGGVDGGGNGGGGGGGGGQGGNGGTGGGGGYGSFAVFLTNSSPVFEDCYFESGQGGRGGAGGSGGRGGAGGRGGLGAKVCTAEIGAGGDGAQGGTGGGGGGGAGGPGGPSFGVYRHASSPVLTNPSFVIGTAGSGGRGGLRGGATSQAPSGNRGSSGEVSE